MLAAWEVTSGPALAVSLGALLAGVVLGWLLARRGRRLRVDWRLTVETDDGLPPPEAQPEPEQEP